MLFSENAVAEEAGRDGQNRDQRYAVADIFGANVGELKAEQIVGNDKGQENHKGWPWVPVGSQRSCLCSVPRPGSFSSAG